MNALNEIELPMLDFIAEHLRCAFLDFLLPKITLLGDAGIFWIILALALLIPKATRKTGVMMAVALILGLIVCNITIKPLVARMRPYDVRDISPYLAELQHDFSFPSGHTTASFEGATVILCRHRKWGVAACVLAALIAFSRMYLYVHYPTDILAGLILGVTFGLCGVWIVEHAEGYIKSKKAQASE